MGSNNAPINDAMKEALKQKSIAYLPQNLGEVKAHRQILDMISEVIPQVMTCSIHADTQIWPKVEEGQLTMNQAIAQCAYQTDKALENAMLQDLTMEGMQETALLRAWISLDYYAYVLKAEYSNNIRKAQGKIADSLLNGKQTYNFDELEATKPILPGQGQGANQSAGIPKTAPIDPKPQAPVQPAKPQQPRKAKKPMSAKNKGILIAAAAVVVILICVFAFNKPMRTERAINAIGTVSLESGAKIEKAEKLAAELSEEQLKKVDNYDELLDARESYNLLLTEDAIDKIGKVTMESEDAIKAAEERYESLSKVSRSKVKNYQTLSAARKEHTRLSNAVQKAKDAIDAIGTVTLDSGSKIEEARSAYDALKKDKLESYVSGQLKTLTAAEEEYAELASENLYTTGMELYKKALYEDALRNFRTIVEKYPNASNYAQAEDAVADCTIVMAERAYQRNNQYEAVTMLEGLDQKYKNTEDYKTLREKINTKLKNSRPNSGVVVDGNLGWGQCYFEVTASKGDICLKIEEKGNPDNYSLVYIREGETKNVNVADGNYILKWASGDYWYEKDHLFGDDTVYMQKWGYFEMATRWEGYVVYFWHYTLDLSENTSDASVIEASEF